MFPNITKHGSTSHAASRAAKRSETLAVKTALEAYADAAPGTPAIASASAAAIRPRSEKISASYSRRCWRTKS